MNFSLFKHISFMQKLEGKLYLTTEQLYLQHLRIGTPTNPICDPNIVPSVAGVLTLNGYGITRVSGTEAITGIALPYVGFQGTITIIPTGIFTWTTATNIALAGTSVVSKAIHFTYDSYAAKWFPSVVA